LRKIDVIGRYGGEEFVILLPETPGRQAYRGITRLRQKIADSVTYTPQGAIQVTVSIGVATLETGAGDITALVDAADKALYKAKNSGRNRVVLYDKPI
jgi:diguanylate cyclase (GGDEF)-like protein